jgi:predicted Zn-dependent protease
VIGKEKALALAEEALAIARQRGAGQAEAAISGNDFSLTRFAESRIHQNISRREGTLTVRVVFGKKVARPHGSSTSILDTQS